MDRLRLTLIYLNCLSKRPTLSSPNGCLKIMASDQSIFVVLGTFSIPRAHCGSHVQLGSRACLLASFHLITFIAYGMFCYMMASYLLKPINCELTLSQALSISSASL